MQPIPKEFALPTTQCMFVIQGNTETRMPDKEPQSQDSQQILKY